LVEKIGGIIGKERPLLSIPPWLGYAAGWGLGKLVNDVIITRPEIEGLMADLLYVDSPPAGQTKLTEWATQHASELGHQYASELGRRQLTWHTAGAGP
jgi:NADH dehydrogenase